MRLEHPRGKRRVGADEPRAEDEVAREQAERERAADVDHEGAVRDAQRAADREARARARAARQRQPHPAHTRRPRSTARYPSTTEPTAYSTAHPVARPSSWTCSVLNVVSA